MRISIASPSASVALTVPPVMRIATDRPLQHTGMTGRSVGRSLRIDPKSVALQVEAGKAEEITACQSAPSPAMRTPPALLGSRSRSRAAVSRR